MRMTRSTRVPVLGLSVVARIVAMSAHYMRLCSGLRTSITKCCWHDIAGLFYVEFVFMVCEPASQPARASASQHARNVLRAGVNSARAFVASQGQERYHYHMVSSVMRVALTTGLMLAITAHADVANYHGDVLNSDPRAASDWLGDCARIHIQQQGSLSVATFQDMLRRLSYRPHAMLAWNLCKKVSHAPNASVNSMHYGVCVCLSLSLLRVSSA